MRRYLYISLFLGISAPLYSQALNLPKVEGITAFYRAGRVATASGLRPSPTAPCADSATNFPVCGWGFETVYHLTKQTSDSAKPSDPPKIVDAAKQHQTRAARSWNAELAVGYDFLTLGGTIGTPTAFELHGTIQTLPSITLYVSRDLTSRLAAYTGLGTGLVVLKNVRAYDSAGRVYAIAGDTWGFTPSVGVIYELEAPTERRPGASIFLELAHEIRDFSSLAYTLPSDVKSLPSDLPRSLSANGPVINFGFEITFPAKTE